MYGDVADILTGLEDEATLAFPDKIQVYFVNLRRLGIVDIQLKKGVEDSLAYEALQRRYQSVKDGAKWPRPEAWDFKFVRGRIDTTGFGTLFLDACLKKVGQ
jgi:Abortive infection alpha